MAKAIHYTEFGGPEVLTLDDIPDPVPAAGQVAIRVEAAGVNPIDWKLREAIRPSAPITKPRGTGTDGAGHVTAVGDDVDGVRVGDPVVFAGKLGAYATDLVVPADKVFARPAGVSASVGAALGTPVGTAYQALRSLAVRGDDTLLVHGGSGSVGQAAIQLAVLAGARVLATTSDARADRVADLGAEPVAYGDGLVERVRDTAPDGVTVVLDCAGTDEALEASVELLEDRSRIATIVRGADAAGLGIRAFSGGAPDPLTEQQLTWRSEAIPVVLALLAAGRFSVELGERFPLDRAADAQRASRDGAPGKLLIVP
ncbi:quinone oxidoreductase family protein [Microbacterium marinilacus]|uniref:NADP-dependent oxidoreductase n=1 Tax=Microbacterium marinilacus TaxID=415209 RepID=A0ABP7B9C6_9MICO|nr:NADP-dependent oxidoreductase [Microbacterium marinilacus]MBY0687311.1 NADP-dependent oxidoreductase [Microbacterium marinilacus]